MIVGYDLDSRMYIPYLIPIHSFRYITVNIDHIIDSEPDKIIKFIDDLKSNGIDHLRLEITDTIPDEKYNILKEYYVLQKDIKFKLKETKPRNIIENTYLK